MSAGISPEGIRRVRMTGDDDVYVFSDGQVPPKYAKAWYEGSPEEVDVGAVVALRAAGPYTETQIHNSLVGSDDTIKGDAHAAEMVAGFTLIETEARLPGDPRFQGETVAEQAAFNAAQYVFALVKSQ